MYLRAVHTETSHAVLRQFVHDNPLGVLTTFIPSPTFPSLQQTHIPWVLDDPLPPLTERSAAGAPAESEPLGILRGHLARANPHAKALIAAAAIASSAADGHSGVIAEDCTILFTSPHSHYITPHYYAATKPATGKVVPTYDYAAVQVYGRLKVYFDGKDDGVGAWLGKQIGDLTREAEMRAGYGMGEDGRRGGNGEDGNGQDATDGVGEWMEQGRKGRAWGVSDAPTSYIEILKKSILGVEVEIRGLQGKWKMSQELTEEGDSEGVIRGLEGVGTEAASEVAQLVRERAKR